MKSGRLQWRMARWGAVWVGVMALAAAAGLNGLRSRHDRAAHQAAAMAVAERGQWLAASLAAQAAEAAGTGEWSGFGGLVDALKGVEGELRYVSVKREGVTLFEGWTDAGDGGPDGGEGVRLAGPVTASRRRVAGRDGEDAEVVAFRAVAEGEGCGRVEVEAGMGRAAVEREEWGMMRAVDSMYRMGLRVTGGGFLLCLVLVAWSGRREARREEARRKEEHLAFSGVLANGIVHDFRNPMSSLRLDAQMLEREAGREGGARAERIGELAGRMRKTTDRMESVLKEFQVLVHPGGTEAREGRERLSLRGCAEDCTAALAGRFEAAGVRVEVTGGGDGRDLARVSGTGIRRALMNVLANALQHAKGEGPVRVRVGREGGTVWVEVEDNGEGIARKDRERVFEMFYTTRPQGTGLGLFLARLTVERSGGRVTALDGRDGGGARLRMEFAAADEDGGGREGSEG